MLEVVKKSSVCQVLKSKREAILKGKLIEEHRYQFGRFDIQELQTTCGTLTPQTDDQGTVLPYEVIVEKTKIIWGQKSGPLRVELGTCKEGVYLQEGDMVFVGRKTILKDSDGTVSFTSIE